MLPPPHHSQINTSSELPVDNVADEVQRERLNIGAVFLAILSTFYTTAFLQLIDKNKYTYNNSILVTLDVVSLYTNIPQMEGADLVTQFYTETIQFWNEGSLAPILPDMLRKLILFILQHKRERLNISAVFLAILSTFYLY